MNFVVVGLILDLVGVALLGFDIIRIQTSLRRGATLRLSKLNEVASEYGGIEQWSKWIGEDAYWTHWYSDEGRMLPDKDSFDPDAAQKSFSEATEAISSLSQHVHKLGELLLSSTKSDKETAATSLVVTIFGLVLILCGFGFQIYGSLF